MRSVSPITLLLLSPLLLSSQWAAAEVFKCTSADGKTSYSQSPCTAVDAKEVVVPIQKAPPSNGPVRNWAAENAAANARVQAAADAAAAARVANKASAPAKSREQAIAECEVNHGVDCSKVTDVADRALTPEEVAALQRAAAGSREGDAASKEAAAAAAKADAAAAAAKADAATAAAAKADAAAATSAGKTLAASPTTATAAAAAANAAAATAKADAAAASARANAAATNAAAARAKANGNPSAPPVPPAKSK